VADQQSRVHMQRSSQDENGTTTLAAKGLAWVTNGISAHRPSLIHSMSSDKRSSSTIIDLQGARNDFQLACSDGLVFLLSQLIKPWRVPSQMIPSPIRIGFIANTNLSANTAFVVERIGCDLLIQQYTFSRPVPPAAYWQPEVTPRKYHHVSAWRTIQRT